MAVDDPPGDVEPAPPETPGRPPWRDHAACLGADPELFYARTGDLLTIRAAQAVCAGCEVRAECLADALARGEKFGVWGGLTPGDRRRLRRQLGASLPDRLGCETMTG